MSEKNRFETERLARAKSRRVMICTPVGRNPVWQYTRSLVDTAIMLERLGIHHRAQFVVGSSNTPKARNELVAHFLASDCTDLLFVDDDMGWQPKDFLRLLASDKQVIGGVGRQRVDAPNSDPNVWCCRWLPNAKDGLVQDDLGAVEVMGLGAAFLKISREVFEAMIAAHPEWKRRGHGDMPIDVIANYFQFFRFDHENSEFEVSEDYVFCARCRELGISVWIDPEITLSHVGSHAFTGAVAEIMTAAAESKAA